MGDNVYFDAPAEWAATSEKSMRERYRELVELPYLTSILAAMPSYWMKDDHDHRFNNSDPHAAGQPSHKSALKIFREQVPIKPDNSDVGGVTYRKILFNEDLELWILEGRDHRSPNSQQDGPLKTILGFKQREWLFKSLKESDARFKVIVSATPIFGPARAASNDNHATSDGFQFEGELIQNFLKDNFEPDEVIVIGADTHWLSHVENKFGFHEFLVGSVGELIVRPERGSERLSPPPIDNIDHYLDKQNLGFLKLNNYRNGAEAKLEIQLINAFGRPLYNYVIGYD
jgi:alkaline phosphatase/alkaline phosphatase D